MGMRTLSAIVIGVTLAWPAAAQMSCYPAEAQEQHLADKFGERLVGAGVDANGTLVRLYVSESGSWTMMVTPPSRPDLVCIINAGEGWRKPEPNDDDRVGLDALFAEMEAAADRAEAALNGVTS